MMNKRTESLKKRLQGNSICAWIFAVLMCFIALTDVFTAVNGLIKSGSMGTTYTESPALSLGAGIRNVILAVVLILLALILTEIKKNGRPFTKENFRKLRAMAILVISCSVIPMMVSSVAGFFDAKATFQLTFETRDFWFIVAGIIIGIISEIFYYGYELQEDVDSIA